MMVLLQLLMNALFGLPRERVDDVLCAKLPAPAASTVLPREKPAPKPRAPTKWEQYAASKGITKTKNAKGASAKNPRVVWDDAVQDWVPGYGYKKVKADQAKNWMMHVKGGADPMEVNCSKELD